MDALSAFAVFADHLNLTRAAAVLRISQPALHAKLATLARQVGRPLYSRVGRRLVLTADGEAVARFARDHDDRLGRFLEELRVTPTSRPIVLAAGHAAYMHVLADVIRFHVELDPRPDSLSWYSLALANGVLQNTLQSRSQSALSQPGLVV